MPPDVQFAGTPAADHAAEAEAQAAVAVLVGQVHGLQVLVEHRELDDRAAGQAALHADVVELRDEVHARGVGRAELNQAAAELEPVADPAKQLALGQRAADVERG